MKKRLLKIKEQYEKGENIISYLKSMDNRTTNSIEDIMISYDFQAGTYSAGFEREKSDEKIQRVYVDMSNIINKYVQDGDIVFEPGTGEATSFIGFFLKLNDDDKKKFGKIYGLDASFSRLKYAQKCVDKYNIPNFNCIMGDMLNMPIADNSCDVVVTFHACEPNGGNEHKLLSELMRVTNKYLLLFEPAYDLVNDEIKRRMEKHGYVIHLFDEIKKMGLNVIEHRLLDECETEWNPTAITIIKKDNPIIRENDDVLADPVSKQPCIKKGNALWCEQTMLLYPIVDDIACMMEDNAIVATKYGDF